MQDAEAICRLKRGEIDGLETLVERYQVHAVRTAYLVVQNEALAEDVVQETLACIARLHAEGRLKRSASLKARVRTAMMILDDPEIQRAAKALLDAL